MIKKLKRVVHVEPSTLLRISAVLTIVGLAFMVWSMVDPTPWPVLLAMSVGQALGTLAFLLYGIAILQDVLRIRRARAAQAVEPPAATPDAPAAVTAPEAPPT